MVQQEFLIIVTGMSGAGQSLALKNFEDMGFFCVDNLPPVLIPKFAEICRQSSSITRVALGIDIRAGRFLDSLSDTLKEMENSEITYSILFLDAGDGTLIRRYSETRRRHPLKRRGRTIRELMSQERNALKKIKERAHRIIDTSNMTPREFKESLLSAYREKGKRTFMEITLISFGYKYGIPLEADLMLDTRFLPNPFYDEKLRPYTGNDQPVRQYVLQFSATRIFLKKVYSLLRFLIPRYIREGKSYLTIGIGCTGGRHRSVVITNETKDFLERSGYQVRVQYRDMER